ncbi:hypothetical protein EVAR_103426_1 [Eumeta japonica]|uniref:Uncharacterized protein n=1 Tax=Eumeta variegata TaxID=151549 RepID=A0A4C1Z8M9_EUMVA|nr:hypothetical protein EVAR_103426_1 [Eumeta japonica]
MKRAARRPAGGRHPNGTESAPTSLGPFIIQQITSLFARRADPGSRPDSFSLLFKVNKQRLAYGKAVKARLRCSIMECQCLPSGSIIKL